MLTQGEPRSFGRLARARDGAVRAVDGWPLWLLALIGLALCFVFYGAYAIPAHRVTGLIAANPFDPPTMINGRPITSGNAYLYSSPLGPLLAWAAGARGDARYVLFSAGVITALIVGTPYLVKRWRGELAGRSYLVAQLSAPALTVQFGAIGQPDPYTIFGATLVALGPAWAIGAGGLLLGFNHFEQGIFIVLAAVVLRWLNGDRARLLVLAVAALLLGKLGLYAYQQALDIDAARLDRLDFLRHYYQGSQWKVATFGNLPTIIFSIYGIGWVALAYLWTRLPQRTARIVLALQVVLFVPTLITLDSTRVAAMVTWPIVAVAACLAADTIDRARLVRWLTYLFVASLLIPRPEVLGGRVVVSRFWDVLASHYLPAAT